MRVRHLAALTLAVAVCALVGSTPAISRPDGPPPPNRWAERDPVAAKRLARARAVVTGLAEQLTMPPENLVQPDAVRRLAWSPPSPPDVEGVSAALRSYGVRSWQVGLVAEPLAAALVDPPQADRSEADPSEPVGTPET